MKNFKTTIAYSTLIIAIILLPGCNADVHMPKNTQVGVTPLTKYVDSQIRVQFRYDVLGVNHPDKASMKPLSYPLSTFHGPDDKSSIRGKLEKADDDWIVLKVGNHFEIIPTQVILHITTEEKTSK